MCDRLSNLSDVLAISTMVTLLAINPAATQEMHTAAVDIYAPPRTADGQPDLQGFWTNNTYTLLQRPENITKEFYTPEEAAEIRRKRAIRESEQTEPGSFLDVHYDYTQFGLDRSQGVLAESLRTSMIVDPPDGRIPPLAPEGQVRASEREKALQLIGDRLDTKGNYYNSVENQSFNRRCIVFPGLGPPMLNAGYNNTYQIVQSPGYVMILVEMAHDVRIIPLDGREQPHSSIRQWKGTSRGHWQGDTLVVETTNFNGKNPFPPQPFGTPASGKNLHVTEWFTRIDADTILYKFTVEDETTWTLPWSAELLMKATQGPIFEFACHEGNYSMINTLAGVRAEEQRAAEVAKGIEPN